MTGSVRATLAREGRATVRNWAPYLALTAAVFGVATLLGAAVGAKHHSPLVPVRSPGDPVPALAPLDLFVHNLRVAATLAGGVLLFGVPTLYVLALNGFLFGSTMVDAAGSLGPVTTLALVGPHGLFELPAIWLAAAVATRWLHVLSQTARGGSRRVPVHRTVIETILAVLVVLVLLLVAAVLEGTATAALARSLS